MHILIIYPHCIIIICCTTVGNSLAFQSTFPHWITTENIITVDNTVSIYSWNILCYDQANCFSWSYFNNFLHISYHVNVVSGSDFISNSALLIKNKYYHEVNIFSGSCGNHVIWRISHQVYSVSESDFDYVLHISNSVTGSYKNNVLRISNQVNSLIRIIYQAHLTYYILVIRSTVLSEWYTRHVLHITY